MGVIPVRIKSSGKVTNVSLRKDSFTALMHHDPSYLGPLILTLRLRGVHMYTFYELIEDQKYLKML